MTTRRSPRTATPPRHWLHLACALLVTAIGWTPGPLIAQGYPTRPVKLVVPFPPGGSLDFTGRLIAQRLTEMWGQSVVVENKPGAGGNIGADFVAKSAPDGYTILMGALSTHAVNPSLYTTMPYDAVRDFAPITLIATHRTCSSSTRHSPVNNVKEFIAYTKANPGKLSFGSGSIGSGGHLAGELYKVETGTDAVHVPVQGRRAGDAGAAGRRHAVHVRQPRQRDGAGQGRQAEGARGDDRATLAAGAGPADDGRSRPARIRHLDVVRALRAGRHAAADRREVERRRHEDPDDARRARKARWPTAPNRRRTRRSSSRR